MAFEEYEPVMRKIMWLRERIAEREEKIKFFETLMLATRQETGLSHRELMTVDRAYRSNYYRIMAFKRWQKHDRKLLEELKKIPPPPIRYLKLAITFSIETGGGHEPMFAEVTCETVMSTGARLEVIRERSRRIANAVIKLFWILFDAFKCIKKEKKQLWGAKEFDDIISWAMWFQKYADVIEETNMDNFFKAILEKECLKRNPEDYATYEAIIKIGIEYHYATKEMAPEYPTVHALIEKGKVKGVYDWTPECNLIIAHKTDIDLPKILGIGIEWERRK